MLWANPVISDSDHGSQTTQGEGMPDPIDVAVGQRVKLRRKQRRLSQSDLGLHLGLTFQQIQKYENGSNRVSASMLTRIAERLNCSVASLFGEEVDAFVLDGPTRAMLAQPGALELARAYAASTPRHRRLLLDLARTLAASVAESAPVRFAGVVEP
jgi:transcriptional regulator with XRE-family HTH domain